MSEQANAPKRNQYLTRWTALKNERSTWMSHWKEISDYLLPRSGRFFTQDRNNGNRRHNNIYDSTGTQALRVLAAGMMSGMTSPARPWFRLSTADPDLAKFGPVKQWLNQTTVLMRDVFARSNTYRALHSMYEELGAFGTAGSIVLGDFNNVIHHYPLTAGEYCIATNYRGEVNTIYREFDKTVGELVAEFGIDNVSQTVKNLYDRNALDQWVTIIHAIEPRTDRDMSKRDNQNMPWRSVYFEVGADPDKFLRQSGFENFPGICPRWATSGGDIYGGSPGMEALGDIKQLQQEQLRKAQGIDYMTKPPLQVPSSIKNHDVDSLPGGITFIDAAGQNGIRTQFEVRLDLNHLLMDIQDVRGRIRSAFYADLFLMLANQTDTRMTATEVAERHEEKLLMLGPVLERLHNEMLDPMVEMTFDRMLAAGIVPPPPPDIQGQNLNVEFVSMLAQAQQAVGTNSVDRFVATLGSVAQLKPEVLDKLDADKWADAYSDMLGVDPELVVPSQEVARIRQARAQAQQQAQATETAPQIAQAAKNASQVDAAGLQDVMNMFSGYTTPPGA
jgi:hypothetical protein